MSVTDSRTYGRTRLSFASEADIDEFVATLEKFERGEITADQWRAFRLVRGTYGQRQDGDAQMLRVKVPQGVLDRRSARRAGRRRRALLARLRAHHDAPEHPVPLREAARRRAGDAPARRGRDDDARGVRQLGAQHHRLPVRRRGRRRGLRRDAVRRGADALPSAPPAQRRRCRASSRSRSRAAPRITSRPRSTTSASARWSAPSGGRGFRVTAGGGTAILCRTGTVLYEFLPASEIFRVGRGDRPRLPPAGRLQAQAAQPDEVPDQVARLGRASARSTSEELAACRRGRGADARDRAGGRTRAAPAGERPAAPTVGPRRRSACSSGEVRGPGITPDRPADAARRRRGLRALARDERAAAEAVRLLDRDGDGPARRPHQRAVPRAGRPRRARTATARCA